MGFSERYKKLNTAQQEAVDTIDGPVMVIAGPGTGKTELISMRVANIIKKTDTLPENILCLTFTESGASAMRERLIDIIGKDAYKVAVHTFHSFCEEIINQNREYFYHGAEFKVANELNSYEILNTIFDELKHDNPLTSRQNGEYTHMKDSVAVISELKSSGLVGEELNNILDANQAVIEKVNQLIIPILSSSSRIDKSIVEKLSNIIEEIRSSDGNVIIPDIKPLSKIIADTLSEATSESLSTNKTNPVTAWKNAWFIKDEDKNYVLKASKNQKKLRELIYVYDQYISRMQSSALYDFDDMILNVVNTMKTYSDLKYNLQEKYQYIMVDEFQDTNLAQMRILNILTDNIVNEDMPNIFIVGDDDQAIYSFQGAEISNILSFQEKYPKTKLICLTDNYRSTQKILDQARSLITQGVDRLEDKYDFLNKSLIAKKASLVGEVNLFQANTSSDEKIWLVSSIEKLIKSGVKPNSIAIITRKHSEIRKLLPYFHKANIRINYEKRDNVLEMPIIILIEKLANLVVNISEGNHDKVNQIIPEIISHKMWGIDPKDIWNLSLRAYDSRKRWLEIMQNETNKFKDIYDWLINTSTQVLNTPVEEMIDILIGKDDSNESFKSPLFEHFFNKENLKNNPEEYITYLESLRTIRSKLREYQPNQIQNIKSFVEFINLNRKAGNSISLIRRSANFEDAINIMTAHKSKGLEFDHVYIINAIDNIWGKKAHGKNRMINYPENMTFAKAGDSFDERLRLFYVAMTRAKNNLNISFSKSDDSGKQTFIANFLNEEGWTATEISTTLNVDKSIEVAESDWYENITINKPQDIKDILLPRMKKYKMSATHLNNFLDLTRGGPQNFFIQNVLKFPQAKSASSAYGTAIHDTLQQAHIHISSTGKKQAIEDIVSNFESNLKKQRLSNKDYEKFLRQGSDNLTLFLEQNYDTFIASQKTEVDFSSQNSQIEDVKINGKLDLVNIDKNTKKITITDYKTGTPASSWKGYSEFEKVKLHNYKHQLMFYHLLVENSRDFNKYKIDKSILQFVEPSKTKKIQSLVSNFNQDELDEFKKLLKAVWLHIINLDMPDTSIYEVNLKGILDFEKDLIENNI